MTQAVRGNPLNVESMTRILRVTYTRSH